MAHNILIHLKRERLTGERGRRVAGGRSEGLTATGQDGIVSDDDNDN